MDRKNLIALIAGSLAILLLICILLVGILDNIWPWDGVTAYSRLISTRTQAGIGPKETTAPTEAEVSGQQGNAGSEQSSQQQGNAGGEQSGQQQGNAGSEQGSQQQTRPTIGEVVQKPAPTTPTVPNDEIVDEIGGIVITPPATTDTTQATTKPTENDKNDKNDKDDKDDNTLATNSTESTVEKEETTESTGSSGIMPTDEKADKEFDASMIPGW